MPPKSLTSHLAPFREAEKRDQLAGVVDDREAIRVLAAWRLVRWTWHKPRGKAPTEINELWYWLWAGGKFDLEALSAAAGHSRGVVERSLAVLVNARIVYPDGSISVEAARLVEAHTNQRYPVRSVGRPKGSKNKTTENA